MWVTTFLSINVGWETKKIINLDKEKTLLDLTECESILMQYRNTHKKLDFNKNMEGM